MPLKRIKYVSRFARALSRAEVDELVEAARRRNAARDISGALVTTGELFLQVLEGPTREVDLLYARIRKDERHQDVLLLSSEDDIPTRLFPDWSMQKFELDGEVSRRLAPLREILATIVEQRRRLESLTRTLELALLDELS